MPIVIQHGKRAQGFQDLGDMFAQIAQNRQQAFENSVTQSGLVQRDRSLDLQERGLEAGIEQEQAAGARAQQGLDIQQGYLDRALTQDVRTTAEIESERAYNVDLAGDLGLFDVRDPQTGEVVGSDIRAADSFANMGVEAQRVRIDAQQKRADLQLANQRVQRSAEEAIQMYGTHWTNRGAPPEAVTAKVQQMEQYLGSIRDPAQLQGEIEKLVSKVQSEDYKLFKQQFDEQQKLKQVQGVQAALDVFSQLGWMPPELTSSVMAAVQSGILSPKEALKEVFVQSRAFGTGGQRTASDRTFSVAGQQVRLPPGAFPAQDGEQLVWDANGPQRTVVKAWQREIGDDQMAREMAELNGWQVVDLPSGGAAPQSTEPTDADIDREIIRLRRANPDLGDEELIQQAIENLSGG